MSATFGRSCVLGLALACFVIAAGGNLLKKWGAAGAVVPDEVALDIYGSDCPNEAVDTKLNPTCPTTQAKTCSGYSTDCTSYLCGWDCTQSQKAPQGDEGAYHFFYKELDCSKTITYPCLTGTLWKCYCDEEQPSPVSCLTYSGPVLCFIGS